MSAERSTPSRPEFRDVEIHVETASLGLAIGLFKPTYDDTGTLTTTIMGDAWLRQWCEQRLREHEERGR